MFSSIWNHLVHIDDQDQQPKNGILSFGLVVCWMKSLVVLICLYRQLYVFPSSCIYSTLHSLYIIIWWVKHFFGWNPSHWNTSSLSCLDTCSIISSMVLMYLSVPYLIQTNHVWPSTYRLIIGLSSFVLGIVFHVGADIEKNVVLSTSLFTEKEKRVVIRGLWSICRNPNYLGECGIYFGLCLFVQHPIVWCIFMIQQFYWIERMKKKDVYLLNKYRYEYKFYMISTPYLYIPYVY